MNDYKKGEVLWAYLNRFVFFWGLYQTKRIRILHMLILLLVISQLIVSNWMTGTKSVVLPFWDEAYLFTWIHIVSGFVLFFLTFFLVVSCFNQRGLRYFYPYLWGDFKQIKEDISSLLAKRLPESSPKGLVTTVQGLGLGALSIVIISGIVWFILWLQQSPLALEARSIHKSLTILIEIYIYGHGGLGVIHFIIWKKTNRFA